MEEEWTYCPRCGAIPAYVSCLCGCKKRYKIDPKWGINKQRQSELLTLCKYTPVYNFINDRLVDESAVLRPLS